eukprot:gnl/Dysnectes_brevis/2772_a3376_1234.p1 GENE.gnl/Dysnectes_brevis/2772_a3376_1234~~gnl/Dysnectes_brevis/2772_a3376_1234.p1  ORF type:complete len:237 (+),score=35.57 gnl/Dysnectes_brevis/2772_a3376_1234:23-733(+)
MDTFFLRIMTSVQPVIKKSHSSKKKPPAVVEIGEMIAQGAEARVFYGTCNSTPCVIKERFEKKYRHPDLDKTLRRSRTKGEAKALTTAAAAGIRVPKLLDMDLKTFRLAIERLDGQTVASILLSVGETEHTMALCKELGTVIGQLHGAGIIHNDLTTSNFMSTSTGVAAIDFGLAKVSVKGAEHRAVDLYVLERALRATCGETALFTAVVEGYRGWEGSTAVLTRYQQVKMRGRKR